MADPIRSARIRKLLKDLQPPMPDAPEESDGLVEVDEEVRAAPAKKGWRTRRRRKLDEQIGTDVPAWTSASE